MEGAKETPVGNQIGYLGDAGIGLFLQRQIIKGQEEAAEDQQEEEEESGPSQAEGVTKSDVLRRQLQGMEVFPEAVFQVSFSHI
jgi:hypothetical protein